MASINGEKYNLSSSQRQALSTEIKDDPENKGYAGKTKGGIVRLLNLRPLSNNPTPRGDKNLPPIALMVALGNVGLTFADIKKIVTDNDGVIIWTTLVNLSDIDINSDLVVKMLNALQSKSLLSAAKVQAIKAMGKIPDPSWRSKIAGKSRGETLFLNGLMIEGMDIRLSLGEAKIHG